MWRFASIFFPLFILTIPFGYYRRRVRRFSRAWGRCIYMPILISIALRRLGGVGYEFIPIGVFAVLSGHITGGYVNMFYGNARGEGPDGSGGVSS